MKLIKFIDNKPFGIYLTLPPVLRLLLRLAGARDPPFCLILLSVPGARFGLVFPASAKGPSGSSEGIVDSEALGSTDSSGPE